MTPSVRLARVRCGWLAVVPLLCVAGCSAGDDAFSGRAPASSDASAGGRAGADSVAGASGTGSPGVLIPDAGTAGSGSSPEACAAATFSADLRPLTLYILLDQSGSMKSGDDRWTPVTSALSAFFSAPESQGVRVALQYFGLGATAEEKCLAQTYANPEVSVELPAGIAELDASLAAHDFPASECCTNDNVHHGTPTRPAVEGATSWLTQWLAANPGHAGVLLLATDGSPSDICDANGVTEVAAVIAGAASANIPTYVVGIGVQEILLELAEAGGTGYGPFVVDGTGAQTELEFLQALQSVRGSALACDYDIPQGAGADRDLVNVQYSAGASASAVELVRVDDPAGCDPAVPAWYYSMAAGVEQIKLCPQTCDDVSAAAHGKVDIVAGCATRVR